MVTIKTIMPLRGSILQDRTCKILSWTEKTRWRQVWQYGAWCWFKRLWLCWCCWLWMGVACTKSIDLLCPNHWICARVWDQAGQWMIFSIICWEITVKLIIVILLSGLAITHQYSIGRTIYTVKVLLHIVTYSILAQNTISLTALSFNSMIS